MGTPAQNIAPATAALKGVTWVAAQRPDHYDHPLETAVRVQEGRAYKWVRKTNNPQQLYVMETGTDTYHCATCGSEIQSAQVAHTIDDGPSAGVGSGECDYEEVPFCPTCEKKPNFLGKPLRIKF